MTGVFSIIFYENKVCPLSINEYQKSKHCTIYFNDHDKNNFDILTISYFVFFYE